MALGPSYRDGSMTALSEQAGPHLAVAGEALHLAVLLLDDARAPHVARPQRSATAERVRDVVLDACAALSRARVYEPAITTYAAPIVLACEDDADAELNRLHRLIARLAWANHHLLPARTHAEPLEPSEEASLQRIQATLTRASLWSSSIVRARPFLTAATLVMLAPFFGPLSAVAGIAVAAVAGLRELRDAANA